MSDVSNLRPSTSSLFKHEDDYAVIIAIAKANDKGHTSTVYCMDVAGDFKNHEYRVFGKPFRLHNKDGRYIWCNHYLREERLKVESIVSYKRFRNIRYCENTALQMQRNQVICQLQFGEEHSTGVAYYGIEDAFPHAVVSHRGVCRQDGEHNFPEFALVSMKAAYTIDERIVLRTRLDEVCNLKINCRDYRQLTIDKVNLPVRGLSSEDDVGDVVLIRMAGSDDGGQAICEGVLIRTPIHSYNMRVGHPRGLCVIINNMQFSDENMNRRGANHDERELIKLFEKLLFEVDVRKDLKFDEMRKVAIEYAKLDHSDLDAFVFIMMSHGDSPDVVYDVDQRAVRVEDLTSEFKASRCPTLRGKPKLFFIQACRGQLREGMPSWSELCTDGPNKCNDSCVSRLATSFFTPPLNACPREADFLLAFSSAPGYVSNRNPDEGSWFIQVLVDVIRRLHNRYHLLDMLLEVNRRLIEEGLIQVSNPSHTLRAQVWL